MPLASASMPPLHTLTRRWAWQTKVWDLPHDLQGQAAMRPCRQAADTRGCGGRWPEYRKRSPWLEDGLVSRWVAVPREVWKVGGGGHYLAQVTKCDRRAGQVVLCYKVPQWSCIFQTTAARAAVTESPHEAASPLHTLTRRWAWQTKVWDLPHVVRSRASRRSLASSRQARQAPKLATARRRLPWTWHCA